MASIPWERAKKYVTESWQCYLVEFVTSCNEKRNPQDPFRIDIIENILTIPLLRENDSFIMEEFTNSNINKNNLRILNIMRMSIRAITLSDICTADFSA